MRRKLSKRRYLTLIEFLIATFISAIVIFFLFSGLKIAIVSESKTRSDFRSTLSTGLLHARLNKLFSSLTYSKKNKDAISYFFALEDQHSLVFTFNQGPDTSPLFSGEVLGKLEFTQDGNLILSIWPLPDGRVEDTPPCRQEVLLTQVEDFSFDFFAPYKKEMPIDPQNAPGHTSFWLPSRRALPAIITLKWTKNQTPQQFSFSLLDPHTPIEMP